MSHAWIALRGGPPGEKTVAARIEALAGARTSPVLRPLDAEHLNMGNCGGDIPGRGGRPSIKLIPDPDTDLEMDVDPDPGDVDHPRSQHDDFKHDSDDDLDAKDYNMLRVYDSPLYSPPAGWSTNPFNTYDVTQASSQGVTSIPGALDDASMKDFSTIEGVSSPPAAAYAARSDSTIAALADSGATATAVCEKPLCFVRPPPFTPLADHFHTGSESTAVGGFLSTYSIGLRDSLNATLARLRAFPSPYIGTTNLKNIGGTAKGLTPDAPHVATSDPSTGFLALSPDCTTLLSSSDAMTPWAEVMTYGGEEALVRESQSALDHFPLSSSGSAWPPPPLPPRAPGGSPRGRPPPWHATSPPTVELPSMTESSDTPIAVTSALATLTASSPPVLGSSFVATATIVNPDHMGRLFLPPLALPGAKCNKSNRDEMLAGASMCVGVPDADVMALGVLLSATKGAAQTAAQSKNFNMSPESVHANHTGNPRHPITAGSPRRQIAPGSGQILSRSKHTTPVDSTQGTALGDDANMLGVSTATNVATRPATVVSSSGLLRSASFSGRLGSTSSSRYGVIMEFFKVAAPRLIACCMG